MKTQSCRNSVVSLLRSCAIGSSTCKAIEDKPPSSRSEKMLRLHRAQLFDAITRTDEGDMGHFCSLSPVAPLMVCGTLEQVLSFSLSLPLSL